MEKIRASIVVEILGRPAERVTEALQNHITKLGAEKGIKILNKNFHEPVPVEKSNDLFTAFAEIEFEVDSVFGLIGVVFAYMPSHMEVFSPEKLSITNVELSELTTRLSERLHNYDALAKKLVSDREQLAKKLYEVAPRLFDNLKEKKSEKNNK